MKRRLKIEKDKITVDTVENKPPNLRQSNCCEVCDNSEWLGNDSTVFCNKYTLNVDNDNICDDYK